MVDVLFYICFLVLSQDPLGLHVAPKARDVKMKTDFYCVFEE